MNPSEIIDRLKIRLNEAGRRFGLTFEVSSSYKDEGGWTQFFVRSNADKSNSAAEMQIITNVESELTDDAGREILLLRVLDMQDVA